MGTNHLVYLNDTYLFISFLSISKVFRKTSYYLEVNLLISDLLVTELYEK